MGKELVIGSNRHETKVAILEDDQLVEVFFQRAHEYSLAGSIHKGRVTRVLPGMQSAFVDLGLERDTFLYVSDFFEEHPDVDTIEEKPQKSGRPEGRRDRAPEARPFIKEAVAPAIAPEAAEALQPNSIPEPADAGADTSRDHRGRRSRRRRPRSHGFPETKYAQPPAAATERHEAAPPKEPTEQAEAPAEDVILLPGESLAKYRHPHATAAAPAVELGRETEEKPGAATGEVAQIFVEPVAENKPEELALAHVEEAGPEKAGDTASGDDSPLRDDFPIALVSDIEPSENDIQSFREDSAEDETEMIDLSSALDIDFATPLDEAVEETTGIEPEAEEAEGNEVAAEHPNGESESTGAAGAGSPATDIESSASQSASLREQGGRSMHRMSRRMRRRRGGRFNQQGNGQGNGGDANRAGDEIAAAAPEPRINEPKPEREEQTAQAERPLPSITDLLKAGQEIIVQIAKEPLGQKGARITSHVALPGRYVVYMPSVDHMGVSRKIASDEERHRLKKVLQAHRAGTTGGFIVRTAGEGHTEEEIAADMNFLYNLWLDIRQKAEKKPAPLLLHHDLDVVRRILRDQLTDDFKAIWVDQEDMYENVLGFVQRFQPALVNRVKMYTRAAPIFDAFNITQELEKALRPKVWLKSGGYIVINQTEALVAIDVNTGKFVGKSNRLEDTIVKTNTEAVKEIVRQIRLRDLGGIIVVDFIDMDERKNRQKVMQTLEEAMKADKAPYKILQFNDFGLVAITRKRVKQSLERTLCAPCPYCEGAGYVKSVQTIVGEILVEAQKLAAAVQGEDVMLRCHPEVAKTLKSKDNRYLEELEEILSRPVLVKSDPLLHHEKFDLA
ncbi:MAG TPA: Rne/Rng family ribonuclease [Bryobacteraceae bacterium]|nr:Rne/Rng family ribonuclease [Bryobacteraceae bacterium]